MNSNSASDEPDRRPGDTGGGRVPPSADGVAPTRGEVDDIDWSGGREAAVIGRLLDSAVMLDRWRIEQVEALVQAIESGAAESVLGVAVEVVLSQSGRVAREEARRLLRAAHTLVRMPAMRHGFREGWLSWSQVDAISWHVRDVQVGRLAEIDDLVGQQAVGQAGVEADSLLVDVEWAVAKVVAEQRKERDATPVEANRLWLQPRLDGSGDLRGSFDALRFPVLADAIEHAARDLAEVADPPSGVEAESMSDAALSDAHRHAAKVAAGNAARRAAALFGLVTGWGHDSLAILDGDDHVGAGAVHPDGDDGHAGHHGAGGRGAGGHGSGRPGHVGTRPDRPAAGPPAVLLTAELDSLLDGTTPVHVLNRLTGRMRVTAEVARRWVQARGADVRLVVMDAGQPVGVGRRTRVPPGWLRDAVLARDLYDTAPCSTTAGLLCDIDHTIPFDDDNPEAGGATDIENLALLSRRWHTRKTRGQLRLDRHADGTAAWTVTRTGYQVRTRPSRHLPGVTISDPAGLVRLRDIPAPGHHDDTDGRAPP